MRVNIPISLYWKCQLVGWSVASLYWSYTGITSSQVNYLLLASDFIGDIGVCVLITHAYRNFSHKMGWHALTLAALAWRITIAIAFLGTLFMVFIALKLYLLRLYFNDPFPVSFPGFFDSVKLTLFITGIRLMSIWVLAYHLYHYAEREINVVKENARLKEAQLNNLTAQLNPHFFFNSLNNIKFLIAKNPDAARRSVDLLSDLLRNSLYKKDELLIPVKDEINLVTDYLELENLRFEERLQTTISIDDDSSDILIPALSIQTLVENAIKHGINKRKEGGRVDVKIEKTNSLLKISVENPGSLEVNDQWAGLGLNNLGERLKLRYNGSASFRISEIAGHKVLATISIPVA